MSQPGKRGNWPGLLHKRQPLWDTRYDWDKQTWVYSDVHGDSSTDTSSYSGNEPPIAPLIELAQEANWLVKPWYEKAAIVTSRAVAIRVLATAARIVLYYKLKDSKE